MEHSIETQCTAYHEAGHHAMKQHLGFSVGTVTIKPDPENNTLGTSGHHHAPIKAETISRLLEYEMPTLRQVKRIENCIMVYFAGREAERIFRPKKKALCGAWKDHEMADLFLHVLVDTGSRQFPVYRELLLLRTQDTLSTPGVWCAVEGLAKALLESETLSGKDSHRVIKDAWGAKIKRVK